MTPRWALIEEVPVAQVAARGALALLGALVFVLSAGGCEQQSAAPDALVAQDATDTSDATGAGPGTTGAIWVEDADGHGVGVLVRRGSDDPVTGRAIYDLVTVFHPESGLFFEVAMTDGRVVYPTTTFFTGAGCGTPVGISAGGCLDCRAAHGLALLHEGTWWRVQDGAAWEQRANGSSRAGGLVGKCVAHGSSNTKVFPVVPVAGPAPPTTFAAPLRFSWR